MKSLDKQHRQWRNKGEMKRVSEISQEITMTAC